MLAIIIAIAIIANGRRQQIAILDRKHLVLVRTVLSSVHFEIVARIQIQLFVPMI